MHKRIVTLVNLEIAHHFSLTKNLVTVNATNTQVFPLYESVAIATQDVLYTYSVASYMNCLNFM